MPRLDACVDIFIPHPRLPEHRFVGRVGSLHAGDQLCICITARGETRLGCVEELVRSKTVLEPTIGKEIGTHTNIGALIHNGARSGRARENRRERGDAIGDWGEVALDLLPWWFEVVVTSWRW